MIDRLAIINQRVKESELEIKEIARRLHIDRSTIYNWLRDSELPREKIALLGWAIDHDFSTDFAEMKSYHFYFEDKMYRVGEQVPVYGSVLKDEIQMLISKLNSVETEVNDIKNGQSSLETRLDIIQDTLNRLIKAMG